MSATAAPQSATTTTPREPVLARRVESRLRAQIAGDVYFDATTRGMYATDASIYQIMPLGVVVPRTAQDVEAAIAIAREHGIPVTARGGGTSQCGQTVNSGLIVDVSRYLREIVSLDTAARRVRVQPGIVLDALNRELKKHGLFFPVDPSTASRATIGGMTANNSSGARSIRYGIMADNVAGIDAVLADGTRAYFGEVAPADGAPPARYRELVDRVRAIAAREASEIDARIPKVQRQRRRLRDPDGAAGRTVQHGQAARRVGRNARVLQRDRPRRAAAAAREGAGRVPLSHVRRRDALDRGARRARRRSRWSWSTAR